MPLPVLTALARNRCGIPRNSGQGGPSSGDSRRSERRRTNSAPRRSGGIPPHRRGFPSRHLRGRALGDRKGRVSPPLSALHGRPLRHIAGRLRPSLSLRGSPLAPTGAPWPRFSTALGAGGIGSRICRGRSPTAPPSCGPGRSSGQCASPGRRRWVCPAPPRDSPL